MSACTLCKRAGHSIAEEFRYDPASTVVTGFEALFVLLVIAAVIQSCLQ